MAEYTIVFEGHPRDIPGNPFAFKSLLGVVTKVSAGNVCEDADRYREALAAYWSPGTKRQPRNRDI